MPSAEKLVTVLYSIMALGPLTLTPKRTFESRSWLNVTWSPLICTPLLAALIRSLAPRFRRVRHAEQLAVLHADLRARLIDLYDRRGGRARTE